MCPEMALHRKSRPPIHPFMGENLRYWRERRGLNVPALASSISVGKRMLYAVEAGTANLSYPTAEEVARTFRIRVEAIWDHRPPPEQ